MTRDDIRELLTRAATLDTRLRPTSIDVDAWHDLLAGLPRDDALTAVDRHYATSTDRILPGHVRQHCRAIANDRAMRRPPPALPGPPATPEQVQGHLEGIRRVLAATRGRREPVESQAAETAGAT